MSKINERDNTQSVIVGRSSDTFSLLSHEVKNEMKEQVLKRDGYECSTKNGHGCGIEWEPPCLEMDHIIPISMGGPICDTSNIQLLCHNCHQKKSRNIDYRLIPKRSSIKHKGLYQ